MDESEIAPKLYTVGHSTHELSRLVELVEGHGVRAIGDVRRVPRSRRMPHFAGDALARSLASERIRYEHLPELGGFRRPLSGSPNAGWRHDGFRGYADHMTSDEFAAGVARLSELAGEMPTAVMCAEAQWTSCHRRLLADAMVVRGWRVIHIGSDGRSSEHELTAFAQVDGESLTYPPEQESLDV